MDRPRLPEEDTLPVAPAPEPELVPAGSRRRYGTCLVRGLGLTGLALWEALVVLWAALCVTLVVVGIGLVLVPGAFDQLRSDARRQRALALRWSGVRVSEDYRRLPVDAQGPGLRTAWRRVYSMLGDRATWRDVGWHLVNPLIGPVLAFGPTLAIIHGLWGIVLLWLWEPVISAWDNSWYLFVPLRGQGSAVLAAGLGVLEIVAGVMISGVLVRVHGRWVRAVLSTRSRDGLEDRVVQLSQSRSDAVDHESRELRRIERDLHDGAQARLVAMGMTLTAAERLMGDNPEAARAMVAEAKATSAAALTELRELVRGIHPPVLADRGLVDAVRARALESPLSVEVRSELEGRPLPPLESAVYFAVSELLTNVGKHAAATSVQVGLAHEAGALRVTVHDDGRGGADPARGSGLRGLERRLAAFDGYLLVHSPAGGPTTVSIVVPCELHDD